MKHLLIIGFKHVGKTTIGTILAEQMELPFIDLDACVEAWYEHCSGQQLSCRHILVTLGEDAFRTLEHEALKITLEASSQMVVALGGGTPTDTRNKSLIEAHTALYLHDEKQRVYERIMAAGTPSFFRKDVEPRQAFEELWEERTPLYESLATCSIKNDGAVEETVKKIIQLL